MAYYPPPNIPNEDAETRFNMGIEAQKIIMNNLQKYYKISSEFNLISEIEGIRMNAGQAQFLKYRTLKTINLAASALYPQIALCKYFTDKINSIDLKIVSTIDRTGKKQHSVEQYDERIDKMMDNIVIEICISLRQIFRPSRGEDGL